MSNINDTIEFLKILRRDRKFYGIKEINVFSLDYAIILLEGIVERNNNDDLLISMYHKQIELQKKIGLYPYNNFKQRQESININILACIDELSEAMRETCWKNPHFISCGWKKTQKFNNENFQDEIIDLWHFVLNLSIAANLKPNDIFRKYMKKNKINIKRQENDY